MLEPVGEIISRIKKQEIILNFTPKKSNSDYKRRNRFNYVWHSLGNEYTQVRYGYYESKDSLLGPIIILFDDESAVYGHYKNIITVKLPAIHWDVSVREGSPGFLGALDFICRMQKKETELLVEEAKRVYDTYLDIPVPEAYQNVEVPNLWADSGGLSPQVFEGLCKAGKKHIPFDLSDFPGVSLTPNYDSYIPNLLIALLMGANFAGAPVQLKNVAPKNKKVATVANQQPRTQANCINYFTALQEAKRC